MARHWTDISPDPTAHDAVAWRAQTLRAAKAPPVADRSAYLVSLARGKRVLDVGVVQHAAEFTQSDDWLHKQIAAAAAYCLGVDILADEVQRLRAAGYNVVAHDITASPLPEKFDVMIVGEVIEHLGAPQGLFRAAKQMLLPGGRLVLTTPNPFSITSIWRAVRGRCRESVDHVTFEFPSGIAEFAERDGLVLDRYRGITIPRFRNSLKGNLVRGAKLALSRTLVQPECGCENLIYECVLRD